ncbi:MAG TPA: potassium transporter Kup [Verrucomicrobiales bacterium]|nr:potassium transporter Kup [Verrucomicrobiales bacterium]
MTQNSSGSPARLGLALGALGVVYGDIGTSPLYTLSQCFNGPHSVPVDRPNVLGIISLILWSLVLIVCIKYLGAVMRAENHGEGGILAILALAIGARVNQARGPLVALGVFGAALLYGDGMLTPAVTVLGAIEGLNVATNTFQAYVVPIAVVILVLLFSVQRVGTGAVGKVFGPVMVIWFVALAALGIHGIVQAPEILNALNPWHGLHLLASGGLRSFLVLGSVFLAVTGAEALYADMGHFGLTPIRRAWFWVVFPGLILNYLGQGAVLLVRPEARSNPFYNLAPAWALYPMVVLSTLAAIIASQALISGAFSLTMQGIQLGYIPRLNIQHTSSTERGQIYIPPMNWALMVACIGLVIGFKSSDALAAAYGIAVTLTMMITSVLFGFAARKLWGWSLGRAVALSTLFVIVEAAFLAGNAVKFMEGGWFPLMIGAIAYTLMSTWKRGRILVYEKLSQGSIPLDLFLEDVKMNPPVRVRGTAVFLCGSSSGTPQALLHNLKHNKVLHERTVLLHIATAEAAHVPRERRLEVLPHSEGFYSVTATFGFMEEPNVEHILAQCAERQLEFKAMETTFFLGRETILPTKGAPMAFWRERLFAFMSRNAQQATAFFRLPANRVVELGMQVEI